MFRSKFINFILCASLFFCGLGTGYFFAEKSCYSDGVNDGIIVGSRVLRTLSQTTNRSDRFIMEQVALELAKLKLSRN